MTYTGADLQITRTGATGSYDFDGQTISYTRGGYSWSGHYFVFCHKLSLLADGAGNAAVEEALG